MKRILLILFFTLGIGVSVKALNYEDARREAWFLTDKMAYELNLTPAQYDRAYQVNLDYFMSINTANDCYGYYWTYRDADFRCILFDWQYSLYTTLDYFYRPIRWVRSAWYYPIFDRYRRGYYYFDRPTVYISYQGGMWKRRGHKDLSPYYGVTFRRGHGMRDNYHNGARPDHRPEYGRPGDNGGGHGHKPDYKPDNNRPGYGGNAGQGGGHKPDNNGNAGNNRGDRPSRDTNTRPSTGRGTTGGGTYTNPGGKRSDASGNASSDRSSRSNSSTTRQGGGRSFGR